MTGPVTPGVAVTVGVHVMAAVTKKGAYGTTSIEVCRPPRGGYSVVGTGVTGMLFFVCVAFCFGFGIFLLSVMV